MSLNAVILLFLTLFGYIRDYGAVAEWLRRNEYYYYFSSEKLSVNGGAQTRCQTYGGELLSITSEEESTFIHSHQHNKGYVIGLHTDQPCDDCADGKDDSDRACRDCRNTYKWYDDANMTYRNWEPGQPSDRYGCVRLMESSVWRRAGCDDRNYMYICKFYDKCSEKPCVHGSCNISYSVDRYHCHCDPCFKGNHCDEDKSGCMSEPCKNGGTCNKECNSYTCACPKTYTGQHCENDVDECQSDNPPCMNGGTCGNVIGGFNCYCTPGWKGDLCFTDVDECEVNKTICSKGKCKNTAGSYQCVCPPGVNEDGCTAGINDGEGASGLRKTLYVLTPIAILLLIATIVLLVLDIRDVKVTKRRKEDWHKRQNERLMSRNI